MHRTVLVLKVLISSLVQYNHVSTTTSDVSCSSSIPPSYPLRLQDLPHPATGKYTVVQSGRGRKTLPTTYLDDEARSRMVQAEFLHVGAKPSRNS